MSIDATPQHPVSISLDLDFNSLLRGAPVYDADGDIIDSGPATLEDLILDGMISKVLESYDVRCELTRRIASVRDEVIRERIEPIIADALETSIATTNHYGEPTGRTTTLRELIVAEAMSWLTKPRQYDKASPLAQTIAEQVDKAMKAELTAAINDAKQKALQAVQAKGAEFLATAVAGMVK